MMVALSAMAIIAMLMRVVIVRDLAIFVSVPFELMALHVDSAVEIAVGLVDHCMRKIGLGVA